MNRSILIVICDFLLVSLLVFSSVDINNVGKDGRAETRTTSPTTTAASATNQADSGNDLAAVMKLALADEQKQRESLQAELAQTRATANQSEQALQSSQQRLQSAQQRLQTTQEQLQTSEQRIQSFQHDLDASQQRLQASEQRIQSTQQELQSAQQRLQNTEEQRANLQQQFATAQTNIATLSQQVHASATDATISKEKLAAMEAELRKRAEEAAALQQRMTQLAQSNQMVLNEKQQLAGQLQVAQVEQRHASEQVVAMKEQVKIERAEKAQLVEGVKALATNSTQLAQEIRENRPLTPNLIFDDFSANRVRASFNAYRPGLFDTDKYKETGSLLVANGTNIFAVCHVADTPLTFSNPGNQWQALNGALTHGFAEVPIHAVSFLLQDPRVAFVPVSAADAQKLGVKIYQVSNTPLKFQDAVVIGSGGSYYGECRFELDLSAPAYVKLDRSVLRGLFGKFNPSRGDLAFSKMGDLLGIMVNNTYCLLIKNFDASATFNFGADVRGQKTGDTLAALDAVVQQMPSKLQ